MTEKTSNKTTRVPASKAKPKPKSKEVKVFLRGKGLTSLRLPTPAVSVSSVSDQGVKLSNSQYRLNGDRSLARTGGKTWGLMTAVKYKPKE